MSRGTFINTLLLFSGSFLNQLHQSEVATMNKSRQQVLMSRLVPAFQKTLWHMAEHRQEDSRQGHSIQVLAASSEELSGNVLYFSDNMLFFEEGDSGTSGTAGSLLLPFSAF